MIQVNQVSKSYGEKLILNQVCVSFPKGKISCFIGGNGTGKSTLLSIISRLVSRDKGEINLLNKEVLSYTNEDFAKRLAILKQSNSPNIRLIIKELVSFGRFPHSKGRLKKEDHQKIEESIAFMGLKDIEDQFIDELSGGQRQRAFLAMVLAQDTEYILLDEPLNNLDMKHSVEIMKTLRELADKFQKTIVIVVHDINYAAAYADYIAAVKNHQILYFGPTNEVITEEKMKDVFDIDMKIIDNGDHKVCVYFK
ncbi:ATP-binding cassette domain-containing protein [Myroides sp. NP-2]|uniref:iron ABC transporter ATP-binding protein n=1 Tax=Myroides sp. NP-2 TaxID=2759945 RepID=UPI0015FA0F8D|nr:ATP-binding cassette domain-containing protein [Myroides sp. NP-2]MBB1149823.1 ATP-binding cassette domain-containing protein [Myroides sp. NP-2]